VNGGKPTAKEPWFFNVGRYRSLKGGEAELQIFSPTNRNNWHLPEKFGRLEIK
jgi:hypothetical protein